MERATSFPGVPTMWIAIASLPDLDRRDLSSLTYCGSGGAPLPVEVAKIFERKVGMKLKSGWGMTETCSPGTGPTLTNGHNAPHAKQAAGGKPGAAGCNNTAPPSPVPRNRWPNPPGARPLGAM